VIEQAWLEQLPLHLVYRGAKGVTERRVALRSVVMERTQTLLNCTDLDLGEARQFRLHRIEGATLLERSGVSSED
ncbi:MAG: WYL domain-containing protein, partial [Myxococcota bacterium]